MTPEDLFATHQPHLPAFSLIWTAVVDIAPREDLGETPQGRRFIVPILGGRVFAGPGGEGLSGEVLPGGADRQLVDARGFKTLDALYEMRTQAGDILTVRNRCRIDESVPGAPYEMSAISATAPVGPRDWMNRRVLVGTLETAKPDRDAVIVRGWAT